MPKQPCPGLSMLRTPEGHAFVRLHYSSDPALTKEKVAKLRKGYTSEAHFRKEMEIDASALSGQRVYPEFDPSLHIVLDEEVPKRGCIYMSVDPHPRTPHAVLWLLVDRWSDIYAFREIWPSRAYPTHGQWIQLREDDQDNVFETREYCDMIAELEGNRLEWRDAETDRERAKYIRREGGEIISRRYMDQAGKGFTAVIEGSTETYTTVYRRYGLTFLDPVKAHTLGEDAVREALRPRRHEFKGMWPRLHIAASCKELIAEFPKHRYKIRRTPSEEADMKQEARTKRTHMLDNLRYLLTSRPGYRQSRACGRFEITHG